MLTTLRLIPLSAMECYNYRKNQYCRRVPQGVRSPWIDGVNGEEIYDCIE